MTSQQDLFADSEYPDEVEDRNTLSQEIEEDLHHHHESQDSDNTQSSSLLQLSSWNKRAAVKKKTTPSTLAVPIVKKPGRKRQAPATTADEDDDDDEDEASQVIPSALVKGEKLTSQQEEDAMEWYRDHPDLYAKKSPRYMDTSHKTRLFDTQAKKMGIRCKYNIVFLLILLFFFLVIFLVFCLVIFIFTFLAIRSIKYCICPKNRLPDFDECSRFEGY